MTETEKPDIFWTYQNIKHVIFAALVPCFVFLRDSLDKEHFQETLGAFTKLTMATSDWLKLVEKHTTKKDGLVDLDTVKKVIKSDKE